ncbi:hypothetical protein BH23GEM3_BH23GEM3_00770 [soil metagenome]
MSGGVFLPNGSSAQAAGGEVRDEVFVNSEIENYLRLLQLTGAVAPYPWSIRSFSPGEADRLLPRDSVHPWAGRYALRAEESGSFRVALIRPGFETIYNSAFPYGANDGAVWAGRGLTTVAGVGAAARLGPVSLTLAPIAFRAQNAEFEIANNGLEERLIFADSWMPDRIDQPQRFGSEPYARLDPGQSTLRVDLPGVAIGLSTANQHWGPAADHPILLGNNAPGFLHGFVGTSAPLNLWIGHAHARAVWGRLHQSEYSPHEGHGSRRLMSGYVALFQPRGLTGLELGLARFFHEAWPQGGLRVNDLRKPFEAFLKERLASPGDPDFGDDMDNQLASVFARWVLPQGGFEVYGEFGREDHNWDLRDFLLHPDHDSAYLLGFRKVWTLPRTALLALRGEVLNTQESHLKQVREQFPFYVHGFQRQGHTHQGQVLGSAVGYGGGGSLLATDYVHSGGRITASWRRELRHESGQYWWDRSRETLVPERLDVIHTLGAETLVFRGRWDITAGLSGAYNLNRDYGSDVFNLNGVFRIRTAL